MAATRDWYSKFWVPGDQLTGLDKDGNVIHSPRPMTEEEEREHMERRLRSKAQIEEILAKRKSR